LLDSPRTVHLRGGTEALLRPIRPGDAPALTRLYDRLSPESAYQRFFAVMRRLPPDWARILADVDHDRRAAIVAGEITRFLAYVLADNHRMMRLIGRVGRVTERSISGGMASLRFTRRPDSPALPSGPVAEARS
jgi:hypothetical protein